MASPVGHALAGWIAYLAGDGDRRPLAQGWRHLLLCVVAANLADADFIPGILIGAADRFHRGASHSIGAALAAALLAMLWYRRRGGWGPAALVFGLYLSHLAIDWATRDTRPPGGIPLLWPLSGAYFQSGFPVFLDIRRELFPSWVMLRHNLMAVMLEIALLLPPGLVLMAWRRRSAGGKATGKRSSREAIE